MKSVAIIGLGYVGLPLACLCAEKGLDVYGIDVDKSKITLINEGTSPIDDPDLTEKIRIYKGKLKATDNFQQALENSSIVIVCVPTPVDENNTPNLELLKSACESVSENIKDKTLIIVESTIYPGTIEEIVLPILKKSNKKIYLAHCPERIDPGNKKFTIKNIPRVVAGIDEDSTKLAAEFYRKIIDANVLELNSIKAAEATKIMENTFRDINIAFVNEMAMSFDMAGIDIMEVIKGASTKPFAFMAHYPGAGVGGHCIAVDPYYLISKAKELGFEHKFLSLARKINEGMPQYTIQLLEKGLEKMGKKLKHEKIGVLGLSYKANVDDIRESPAIRIIEMLVVRGAEVYLFDPHAKKSSNVEDLNQLLQRSDYIILATDHNEFKSMDLNKLKENSIKIVIDGRNCLDKEKIKSMGIVYHGIGRA